MSKRSVDKGDGGKNTARIGGINDCILIGSLDDGLIINSVEGDISYLGIYRQD